MAEKNTRKPAAQERKEKKRTGPSPAELKEILEWSRSHLQPYVQDEMSTYDHIKRILFAFIWPLRVIGCIIPGFLWGVIMRLHVALMPSGLYRFQKVYMMWLESWLALISIYFLGLHVHVHGKFAPRMKDGRWIPIVANHQSFFDIYSLVTQRKISYVARADTVDFPIFGVGSVNSDCVFVDRQAAASRDKARAQIKKRIEDPEAISPLVVFPEGTTTNGKYVVPFKTSIFETGSPVQPVIIEYAHNHRRIGWCQVSLLEHVRIVGSQFHTRVDVHVLPVYTPTQEELDNPGLYAENVRQYMAKQGKLQLSEVKTRNSFNLVKALAGKISLDELKRLYDESHAVNLN
ncbi:Acyltransferase [Carpediemonas membranifera]|uniref:Acyltransferase n=1 Tax=Carpediemonas membranifera TaxID=201153 RepID=A0A8J6AV56_9EUKA|nr:Acyltransferase [Carpediemonas membranifera]|eukprot:KAG9394978.1 Acyltransferase [Carpediemonas membranifera]